MAGITYFVALPFDVADGSVVVGEPIECQSPSAAIERAQWKILGHTGAVAFSRTGDPATGDFNDATVLRKFGDVPDHLSAL
jgi:allophanate hydrolase subunit 1